MLDSLLFWHIPSAASEPVTTTFCVRFHSPSSMLKSHCSFNPLWTMNTTIFQEMANLYHILEPIFERLFQKLFSDVHFGAVSLIHSALQRNAATRFWRLFLSVMWLIIFHFFPLSFFSLSFLIFMVTSDWVLCAFVSLITLSSIFNGSEINCRIVDWGEGFPNMVVWKMNIHEHRTRVTRFNSLWVSVYIKLCLKSYYY